MFGDTPATKAAPLVEVRGLTKVFTRRVGLPIAGRREELRAVDNVDLEIRRGETLGLVGESGSGKSTLGRVILDLVAKTSGKVLFEGRDLEEVAPREMRLLRRKMQIVFQDPYSSLHPRMTVRQTIMEGLRAGGMAKGPVADQRIEELARNVGLGPAHIGAYPHQLSGGQRQRVLLAIALANDPALLICDEPTTALDVTVQAQILELIAAGVARRGTALLFITHDLAVVAQVCERVLVLYKGRIVEAGPTRDVLTAPQHDYTRRLLAASELEQRR